MSDDSKKTCSRCIHKKMCIARSSFDAMSKEWNRQYPFVQMKQDGDTLAEICSEYKSLTDIHVIEKPKEVKPYYER